MINFTTIKPFPNSQNCTNVPSYNNSNTRYYLINKKNVDSVSFTSNPVKATYKIGDCIKNIGLIIEKPKVLNAITENLENSCLIYQNIGKNGAFRLLKYDPVKINSLSNLLDKNPQIMDLLKADELRINENFIKQAKEVSIETVNLINDLVISEMTHTSITNKNIRQNIIDLGFPGNVNSEFILLQNFEKKQKNYPKSSVLVAIPMIKALKQSGVNKYVVARAIAMGEDSKSPVELYLRNGLKPFQQTMQDLENHKIKTPNGKVMDPKYEVRMYLPQDANIYQDIEKIEKLLGTNMLEEINKIKPGWFMKKRKPI